ncbi:hypothetical protein IEQ34_020017 [Dendrobium chrysotoxum]|uniref:Uncharacterized protein n=1 Tax=Dendrobium chrysotoxum TaxID=161865 RepID=A0AAV7GBH4_DENCH|nr:hypothetical protein IEQ34_020017 [Dendrobium chrysotoxum]
MANILTLFHHITDINEIMLYACVHFKIVGLSSQALLMSYVITSSVNTVATSVSIASIDKLGGALNGIKFGVIGRIWSCRVGGGIHLHVHVSLHIVLGTIVLACAIRDLPTGD